MKTLRFALPALLAISLLVGHAQARTWTDSQGRTMEASMVSADASSVVVMMAGGRQFTLPLANLSQADQDYVKKWLEAKSTEKENNGDLYTPDDDSDDTSEDEGNNGGGDDRPKPQPGQLTFDGQALITGGNVNTYEFPYDQERADLVKNKFKSDDTGYKIAIAVPHDFDPAKPQKVFIPMTPVNNDGQAKKGNLGQMRSFSKVCVENGWVCIAFDSNLGVMKHNADLYAAMEKLSEVWPNFKSWKFASGGFSGGSKACWSPIAYLVHNDYEVVGAMLAGCNAIYAESNRKRYHASKTGFRNIKVMLSNGNSDNIAPPSRQDSLENVLEDSGMRNVRKMTYDGGHRMNREHVAIALKWFSEAD